MGSKLRTINRASLAYSIAMLLVGVLVVSNALADEQVRTETVKFQDLNVGTTAGVEALYSRIHSAARRVCSETDPVLQAAAIACARNAEAKAIEKVNLPLLTAYYRMKNGGRQEAIVAGR
jgi:UrcA family protein